MLNAGNGAYKPPYYFAAIEDQNGVCGCAVQALPDAFTVSEVPTKSIKSLLADRIEHGPPIKWLTAPEKIALLFGEAWESDYGRKWSIDYRWLLLSSTEVSFPAQRIARFRTPLQRAVRGGPPVVQTGAAAEPAPPVGGVGRLSVLELPGGSHR